MNTEFKNDALLYLAFITMGFGLVAPSFWDKIICVSLAAVMVVVRSFIKNTTK